MSFDIVIVLTVLGLAIGLFVMEKVPVDLVGLIVMAMLLLSRIITPEEGVSGFSNTATVTVGAMFVLSAGLLKTGALNVVGSVLARIGKRSFLLGLVAMMVAVGGISAFINNTAAVAIFLPMVLKAAREAKISPSKLLIPLSFASMFGGVCTLIGTSTNILVSTIAVRNGLPPFGMFEFSSFGLMIFGTGILYMAVAGVRLIPARRAAMDLTEEFGMGDYLTEIVLLPEAKSIGKPLANSPLVRDLDIDILDVFRQERRLSLPPRAILLQANDVLRVRCNVRKVMELQEREGIVLKHGQSWHDEDLESPETILAEAVIAPNSMLEGKSLKKVRFRDRFGATVLAIRHRQEVVHENLGHASLRGGDALLIEARKDHLEFLKRHRAFVLVSEVQSAEVRKKKILPAFAIVSAVVAAATLNVFPIVVSAVVGAILMILTGCLTLEEAYDAIEWKVIFLLAGVLTLGIALEKTGAASLLSTTLISGVGRWGPVALLSALFLLTTILTEVMSNNATAVLLAPIAIGMAHSLELSPTPFLMAVMFAASLSFMTPIGYQTNTLVFVPGRYRFFDYFRVGAPLNVFFWMLATWMIPRIWPF